MHTIKHYGIFCYTLTINSFSYVHLEIYFPEYYCYNALFRKYLVTARHCHDQNYDSWCHLCKGDN